MKRSLASLSLVILMAFTLGCQDQQALAELEEMKAQAEVDEQSKAIVRHFYEQLDAGNLEVIGEVLGTTCVLHYPGNVELVGPQGYRDNLAPFLIGLPDFQHVIEDMVAVDEKVVARFKILATHEGEFFGNAPTGEKVTFTAIGIFRVNEEKIYEAWIEFDALGLMQQVSTSSS
jgi:predicted ester cyclase